MRERGLRAVVAPEAPPRSGSRGLKRALVTLDAIAIMTAFVVATYPHWSSETGDAAIAVAGLVVVAAVGVATAAGQHLYRSRHCAVRSVERARLFWVAVATAVTTLVVSDLLDLEVADIAVVWCGVVCIALLVVFRSGYRHWLGIQRRRGRHLRRVVLVGDDDEARTLADLFAEHPELGVDVCGYVGRRPESASVRELRWLGSTTDLLSAIDRAHATGVVVVATAHSAADLNRIVRRAHDHGVHVTVSSGLHGISSRRIHAAPMSYEPLHQVEPAGPSRAVLVVKRAVDVVGAGVVLVLSLPLMAVVAVAIKLDSAGPVIFRQQRIGRDGNSFTFYKLRTMVPGSDVRPDETAAHNERTGGPLYKDAVDPRRTRVGKVLEATSIDELPQLWNVLRGDMSLVGPRPAISREVEQFDDALLARHAVRPGMTGLWQVECRDNPHFAAYRRLDLFYVENLSLWLDAAILSATVEIVAIRAVQKLAARRRHRADATTATVLHTSEPTMDLLPVDPPPTVRVETS